MEQELVKLTAAQGWKNKKNIEKWRKGRIEDGRGNRNRSREAWSEVKSEKTWEVRYTQPKAVILVSAQIRDGYKETQEPSMYWKNVLINQNKPKKTSNPTFNEEWNKPPNQLLNPFGRKILSLKVLKIA